MLLHQFLELLILLGGPELPGATLEYMVIGYVFGVEGLPALQAVQRRWTLHAVANGFPTPLVQDMQLFEHFIRFGVPIKTLK